MWSHERQAQILGLLSSQQQVSTAALVSRFSVSRETIRRDLLEMEERGLLSRVHGGATRLAGLIEPEPDYNQRQSHNVAQKRAIGRLALTLIPEGSTVFIDTGTTTITFAADLAARGNIRVITNSFEIAGIMSRGRECDVLLLGGRPHRDVPATYGEMTLSQIDRFLADFAVISPVGLHPDRGVTDYELHEAEVARAMMRRARENILLCHSGKIGIESRVSICRTDEIDHLVSDDDPRSLALSLPRGRLHLARSGTAV
ncbi:DeoR/GlpR family DNA-binding transcription regulator [Pseudogemmobacter faecipullorum]|uniref:DeoR/GlpR transcriptional regulator n=1 Tax=Pseudogemmobacter faecipullorum TaxID=2755041 RepID=A0ABS8CMJ9_9RHOB|nr:DeoR/GlpR family DNA-binding transcription regulator [Pseudogemmobacter faecipullorum]MCB5410445.1 DeoR/GlpR transcriptional regulator [Pseudogemmobacter faecipullorum]